VVVHKRDKYKNCDEKKRFHTSSKKLKINEKTKKELQATNQETAKEGEIKK
jgi:hypothetical protein